MDVQIERRLELGIDLQLLGAGACVRDGSVRRLLHDVSGFASNGEMALSGHGCDFDRKQLAADLGDA